MLHLRVLRSRQSAATLIEFALVAFIMFLVFWGIFEFSRDFYVRNTTQHLTRCMARAGVVYKPSMALAAKQECLMGTDHTWPLYHLSGGDLSNQFSLDYLTVDPSIPGCPAPGPSAAWKTEGDVSAGYDSQADECVYGTNKCVCYVRASYTGGPITAFGLLYAWIGSGGSIDEPLASTTMPAENMGWLPPS